MITEFNLPNFKFRRFTRSPLHLQNIANIQGINYLEQKLTFLSTAPCSRNSTPIHNSKRPASGIKKNSTLLSRKKHYKRTETTPIMKYDNTEMPVEFIVMDQFRKGIIKEIEKYQPELTLEKLNEIKSNSVQKELINIDKFKEVKQVQKNKKELISRNYLDNAIYMIRALPNSSKVALKKELRELIPSGSRFYR